MTHEADCGLAVIILLGCVYDGIHNLLEVIVRGQQRLTEHDLLEGIRIACQLILEVVVLQTVHQMSRLNNQGLYLVVYGAVQCLGYVVDLLAVTLVYMVDDDLAGEAAAYRVIRERLLHRLLDGADGLTAAVVIAGAEADYEQLGIANFILIQRIVQGSVTRFIVFVRIGLILRIGLCSGVIVLRVVRSCGLAAAASGQHGHQHAGNDQHNAELLQFAYFAHGFPPSFCLQSESAHFERKRIRKTHSPPSIYDERDCLNQKIMRYQYNQ